MNRREISRGLVPLLAVLLLPAGGASPAGAEWLVTREGGRVEIQGKPQVKGKLVVFTRADGTLSSLRLAEVDLEASERVTAEEKEKAETGVEVQEPAKKKSVASVTDANLVRTKKPEPSPAAAPAGEAAPAAPAGNPAAAGPATVGTWKQQDLPGGSGIELIGSLENKGDKIATGLALTAQLYNETGQLLATGRPRLAEVRVAGDHGDRCAGDLLAARRESTENRNRADARGGILGPGGRTGVDDPRLREGLGDLLLPLRLDGLTDEVAVEERRRTRRTGVRDGDETVVLTRHPQHDVGEGEIGEQLPVPDEKVKQFDVRVARTTLGLDEITEGRHASQGIR